MNYYIFFVFNFSIYQPIDFDGDGEGDNIRFMIKRIKVHTSKALKDTNYRFPGNYGVEKFLEIFSGNKITVVCNNLDQFALRWLLHAKSIHNGWKSFMKEGVLW